MLEEKLLRKVAEEIDNRFTRNQYENILVETGLYSVSTLKDNEEYYKRTKQNLILDTLRLADDPDLIISAAHKKRGFSKELTALLENRDADYEKESVTARSIPKSVQQEENHQKVPEHKKQQLPNSSKENLVSKGAREKPQLESLDKVDYTSVFFIVTPILVVLISLLLVVMQIWDWTVALAVSALVITALAYVNDLLKPKIDQETATRGIKKNAASIFLVITIVFFIALIISLQSSTNDLNKKIIELSRNYNDAVSTLSVQQKAIDQKRAEVDDQATQIKELKTTQVSQSIHMAQLEGTATHNAEKIISLEATLKTLLPTPTVARATPTVTNLSCSELLSNPWHLEAENGDAQTYQEVEPNILMGKTMLSVTYNLHGLQVREGDSKR